MPNKNIQPNRFQRGLIRTIGVDKYLEEYESRKNEILTIESEPNEVYKQKERKIWETGDAAKIEWFYKSQVSDQIYHQYPFWKMVNTNMPRAHYPVASTITNAMGTLLFANTPELHFDSGAQGRNNKLEKRWSEISSVNNFLSLLQEGAQLQSYSGGVAFKINYDSTLADTPIISAYPKEQYKEYKKMRQTIYIDFIDEYDGGYKLVSRYGRGYITYKLYFKDKEVSLDSFDETKGLRDLAFIDGEQNLIPIMFATIIPNKANSKSDYDGLVSSFHALDEAYSSMVNYIRKTKPNIFITEDIAAKDANGKPKPLNDFDNIVTILDGTVDGTGTEVSRDIHKLEIIGYRDAFHTIRENILSKVGISPATVGLDSGGANASGEALNIRERVSSRTRSEKLAIWSERLDELIYAVMMFDRISHEATQLSEGVFQLDEIADFKVKIDFGPYHEKSFKEKVAIYKEAIDSKLASVSMAVEQLYGDTLSNEDKVRLTVEIKTEHGLRLTKAELEIYNEMYNNIESGPTITKP